MERVREASGHSKSVKQQQHYQYSSTSPPLSPQGPACPFVPTLPTHEAYRRTTGTAVQQPSRENDLTQLRAALSSEGVRISHQQQQQQQQHSRSSSLQQLRRQTLPAAVPLAGNIVFDFNQVAVQLREGSARLSSCGEKHEKIDAKWPSRSQGTLSAASSRPGSSLEMAAAAGPAGQGSAAAPRALSPAPAARAAGVAAHSSFGTRSAAADINLAVQAQLAAFGGSLSRYASTASTTQTAAAAGAAAPFSSHSSTEQPLTPVLSQTSTPQRSAGLLGISFSSSSSRTATEPLSALAAAVSSAAGFGLVRSTQQQEQLQQQQLLQSGQLAAAQQLAQAGMAQLQEVTVASTALLPVVASIKDAAAISQGRLREIEAFFQRHPHLMDPAVLQHVLDENRQLTESNRQLVYDNRQLSDGDKQLRNELFSRQQLHNSAVAALREHQRTPADKKTAALQEQVGMLTQQLHARDAGLAASEEDNRRLRAELGLPHRSTDDCRTGSNVSPCKAAVERYGSSTSRIASPDVSRRLVWGDEEGAGHSSTCSIASVSVSPDVQQQYQQQRGKLQREAESLQEALAAKDEQLQQLQQALEQLKQERDLPLKPVPASTKHLPRPRTLSEAMDQLAVLKQSVAALQQQLQEQEQQAGERARMAQQAFQRQLSTEKMQLQAERKNSALLMQSVEELRERLGQQQAHAAQLQQQLDAAQDELQAGEGSCSPTDRILQLQWRLQEKQSALVSLQDSLQELLSRLKAAGRLGGPAAAAAQQSGVAQQLAAAVQQLLADVASQAALLEQQHQQRQGQPAAAQDVAALRRQLEEQQQQTAQLKAELADYATEIRKAHDLQLACEQQLLAAHDTRAAKQALERKVSQLQQQLQQLSASLEGARAELDRVLEDRTALSAHLEQCRRQLTDAHQQLLQRSQQLDDAAAERDLLVDRIREFADRQASCSSSSAAEQYSSAAGKGDRNGSSKALHSSCSNPSGMSPVAQQLLADACAELNQRVALLEKQLDEGHAKEDRLQLANAQLQERLSALQLAQPTVHQDGLRQCVEQHKTQVQRLQQQLQQQHASVQSLQAQLQQQQQQQPHEELTHLKQQLQDKQQQMDDQQQDVQKKLGKQQQQLQGLQQQLQQKEQQLAEAQQQQQHQQDMLEQLQQLNHELEDRDRELLEWQIHADALEKDLADLKACAESADALQQQLSQAQQQLQAHSAKQDGLQQELAQCQTHIVNLEHDLNDAAKARSALRQRCEGAAAELARAKEGAADMRLRLEHFTGPAGPQARIRQLEGSLQSVQRKHEAAESRASSAAAEVEQLSLRLGNAEDEILALEGQVSILEQELAKYAS